MTPHITDEDIRIGYERARTLRAEAAGALGTSIKAAVKTLFTRTGHAVLNTISPRKPQH